MSFLGEAVAEAMGLTLEWIAEVSTQKDSPRWLRVGCLTTLAIFG